jgi:hypothetical protein
MADARGDRRRGAIFNPQVDPEQLARLQNHHRANARFRAQIMKFHLLSPLAEHFNIIPAGAN